MIDLHTHTTASDGCATPAELVAQAVEAGLTVIGVTDHDTTAAVALVTDLARGSGIRVIPGIEVTAVWNAVDVHVLGYFVPPDSPVLSGFLEAQRDDRVRRVRVMADRLAALGMQVDVEPIIEASRADQAVGRPLLARALVERGYVADVVEAFDRFLGTRRPAYEPRRGAAPWDVVERIAAAGGVASLAHPGLLGMDMLVEEMIRRGLPAIEVYHPDQSVEQVERYHELAERHGLAITGGSDYHGDVTHGARLGEVRLPASDFGVLEARAVGARERR